MAVMHKLVLALAAAALASPALAQTPADPWAAKAKEILAASIPFKTTESQKEVPQYVRYLVGEFRKAGVRDDQITVLPVDGTEALVVRIPGRDRAKKAILFSAHMDVVEANPKDWERDPFKFIEENGFYFGRGISDDKAGVAQLATLIIRMSQQKLTPSRDLIFAFIGDEETAMKTTALLAGEKKALIDAEYALNADAGGGLLDEKTGKPTLYVIQGGEKTYSDFTLTVTDPGGHSSAPTKTNAIYRLATALKKIEAHRFPAQSNALTLSTLAAAAPNTAGDLGAAMAAFAKNPVEGPAAERLSQESYLVGQIRTTCVATQLQGGHAPNALPQSASANVNCRIFPGHTQAEIKTQLEAAINDPQVKVTLRSEAETPGAPPRLTPEILGPIEKITEQLFPGVPVVPAMATGATDGRFTTPAGIPTYGVSGIFADPNLSGTHGLNERVGVKQLYDGRVFLYLLVKEYAGGK